MELFFELPHRLADRRPGDAQIASGPREAAVTRYREEGLELLEGSRVHGPGRGLA
jgi:hypothetical protein